MIYRYYIVDIYIYIYCSFCIHRESFENNPTSQVLVLELFQFARRCLFAWFPEEQKSSVGGGKICEAANTIQVGKK